MSSLNIFCRSIKSGYCIWALLYFRLILRGSIFYSDYSRVDMGLSLVAKEDLLVYFLSTCFFFLVVVVTTFFLDLAGVYSRMLLLLEELMSFRISSRFSTESFYLSIRRLLEVSLVILYSLMVRVTGLLDWATGGWFSLILTGLMLVYVRKLISWDWFIMSLSLSRDIIETGEVD